MPFAIMASLTVILVVLWDRSPFVSLVLVGPLLATALYQRWIHGALERLREFDRLKDEFIAIVSHELRTPLTSVYGAAMTLGNQTLDEERRNALIDIVSTESARLARLLDDDPLGQPARLGPGRAVHHAGGAARARLGGRRRDAHASAAGGVARAAATTLARRRSPPTRTSSGRCSST